MPENEKTRVLLVDDDPEISWGVGKLLTRAGCVVSVCGDGMEAVDLLQSKSFDILITDVQMPRMNGLALIEWVVHHQPRLRVVVMTAFGSASVQKVALNKGAILYLEKPFDPQALVDIVISGKNRCSFFGSVDNVDLFDYVQLVFHTMRKAVLKIRSTDGKDGRIFIKDGTAWHAECGEQVGLEAFYSCMSFEGGAFSTSPWEEPQRRTIDMRGDFLLMDAARTKDETSSMSTIVKMGNSDLVDDSNRTSSLDFDLNDTPDGTIHKDWRNL
jgi:CheY-like chemotaxis protein